MDSLIQLLVSLSQNAIRAFRHTATFVGLCDCIVLVYLLILYFPNFYFHD